MSFVTSDIVEIIVVIIDEHILELVCDQENLDHKIGDFPATYVCERALTVRRKARKDGWVFHRDGSVSCPKCSGTKR